VLSFVEVQLWVSLEVRQLFKDKVDAVMQDVEAFFLDELAHVQFDDLFSNYLLFLRLNFTVLFAVDAECHMYQLE
jgi:hypothetical protein